MNPRALTEDVPLSLRERVGVRVDRLSGDEPVSLSLRSGERVGVRGVERLERLLLESPIAASAPVASERLPPASPIPQWTEGKRLLEPIAASVPVGPRRRTASERLHL